MTEICRTCLQEISDNSVIFCLNPDSKSKAISVRCKLEFCVPELDLDVIPNAVICSACFESLNLAHKFKNKCLETEGRIQRYIEKIGYVYAYIDLKEIAQQASAENHHNVVANEKAQELDLTNLHCDTRNFFAVPKIAQLLASGEENSTPNSFKCVHCGYTTSTKPDLETHQKVHLHKCNECDFSAPKRQTLIIHMRQHSKKKFCCNECSYKTPYLTLLTEHNKVHNHKKSTSKCKTKERLKLDLKSHHHNIYKCVLCGLSSSRKENFIYHMQMHNTATTFRLTDGPPMEFSCFKCGYKTVSKFDLEQHIHLHNNNVEATRLNLHIKSNGNDYVKRTFSQYPISKLKVETTKAPVESYIKN